MSRAPRRVSDPRPARPSEVPVARGNTVDSSQSSGRGRDRVLPPVAILNAINSGRRAARARASVSSSRLGPVPVTSPQPAAAITPVNTSATQYLSRYGAP